MIRFNLNYKSHIKTKSKQLQKTYFPKIQNLKKKQFWIFGFMVLS